MSEYVWYKNGKEIQRSRDIEGNKVFRKSITDEEWVEYRYNEDGGVYTELYFKNGDSHRDGDKPAIIYYHTNGQIEDEYYYKNGKQHRDDNKPSRVYYYKDGREGNKAYHRNGVEYDPEFN